MTPRAVAVGGSLLVARRGVTSGGGKWALSISVRVRQPDGVPGDRSPLRGGSVCLAYPGRRGSRCELAAASRSCGNLKAILWLEKELELH